MNISKKKKNIQYCYNDRLIFLKLIFVSSCMTFFFQTGSLRTFHQDFR